jgi:hypothetical protein
MPAPTLELAVLCQDIETDADGRPYNLLAPVFGFRWPADAKGLFRPRPSLKLYLRLRDPVGTFYIRAALRQEGVDANIYDTEPLELGFGPTPRPLPYELDLELDELTFPRPGVYEMVLYANHVSLHDPELVPIPFPPLRVKVLPADGSPGGAL